MLVAGVKAPVPLDELESHLRDEIDRQTQAGIAPQQAFENAIQLLGPADALKVEFKKPRAPRTKRMLRMGIIGLSGTVVLNFLGLQVFHRHSSIFFSEAWWSAWLPCYLLWTTFTVIGLATKLTNKPDGGNPCNSN